MLLNCGICLAGVLEDVADDPHAWRRRIDVGVAGHELLQNVVLNGARQLLLRNALFLRRNHIQRQDRQHRAVHRHRHADLAERDAVEQDAHIQDAVDRHARHADIAEHARIVGIVAAMRRQVEGDAQALLPAGDVALIERVRFFGGREPGILPHRPGAADIHRGIRPAHERREARIAVEMLHPCPIGRGIERLDRDALGGRPVQRLQRLAARRARPLSSQVPASRPGRPASAGRI